jgi:hypothetical protein
MVRAKSTMRSTLYSKSGSLQHIAISTLYSQAGSLKYSERAISTIYVQARSRQARGRSLQYLGNIDDDVFASQISTVFGEGNICTCTCTCTYTSRTMLFFRPIYVFEVTCRVNKRNQTSSTIQSINQSINQGIELAT